MRPPLVSTAIPLRWLSARSKALSSLRWCFLMLSSAALITMAAHQPAHASNGTAIIDDFLLGVWSPFMARVQKSVPVCIWNADELANTFNVTVNSHNSGNQLHMSNDIGDIIIYRVDWLSGNRFRQPERLSAGIPSRRSYTSADTTRCGNGPTGMLRITVNPADVNKAPTGIYRDTLLLTVSPL